MSPDVTSDVFIQPSYLHGRRMHEELKKKKKTNLQKWKLGE